MIIGPIVTSKTINESYLQLRDCFSFFKKNNINTAILSEPHPKSWMRFIVLCRENNIKPIILYEHNKDLFLVKNSDEMKKVISFYNGITKSFILEKIDLTIPKIIFPNNLFKSYFKDLNGVSLKESLKYSEILDQKFSNRKDINYNFENLKISLPKLGGYAQLKREILKTLLNDFEINLIKKELSVIKYLNVEDYILTVKKIVDIAKENNIDIGPGRGSAVSSYLIYKLGITSVNPKKYDLIFERFLNKSRKELPDIDLDINAEKRNDLMKKVAEYFGNFSVCQIRTYSTMKVKSVLKTAENIIGEKIKLKTFYPFRNPKNFSLIKNFSDENKKIFNLLYHLEGLETAESVHAAGFIISAEDLRSIIPLEQKKDIISISQWDVEDLKQLNGEKFDILSLDTLTFLNKLNEKNTYSDIEKSNNFDYLSKGLTKGIFQLDTKIGKILSRKIKPKSFDDIYILISMNRPGPLESGMIDMYQSNSSPDYLKNLFPETNGVIIFQEQIMKIAKKLGNFNEEEADSLRKALSKKNTEKMISLKEKFLFNCSNILSKKNAEELFSNMEKFAQYSFNKSHAVAYAYITQKLINIKSENTEKFFFTLIKFKGLDIETINEIKYFKINLLNPDLRKPEGFYEKNKITLPLTLIKGIGTNLLEIFRNQKIEDFENFIQFCQRNTLNRNIIELLIKAGSLDYLTENRKHLIRKSTDLLMGKNTKLKEIQNTIFGINTKLEKETSTKIEDYIKYEFETIGFPIKILNSSNLSNTLIEKYIYNKIVSFDGYSYQNYIFDNSAILYTNNYQKNIQRLIREL